MSLEFGGDDLPETLEGYDKVPAGSYHFRVTHIEEGGGKKGELVLDAEVQAGTVPNMEGKSHREYFAQPTADQDKDKRANTVKRMILLAIATGLTNAEEYEATKKSGKRLVLHFKDAVGRHFCAKVTEGEYQNKKTFKLGFDIWPIGHKDATGIPINRGAMEKASDANPDVFGDVF
jgi:hypothetical protein